MYQADYDGRDASEGTPSTYTDLGLPVLPLLNVFFDTYVKDRRVLYCPDFVNPEPTGHPITGYKVVFGPEDLFPGSNRFSEVVARQGQNTALMVCDSHSPNFDLSQEPRWTQKRLIIMRLGGHVTNRMYPVRQVYPYE